MYNFPWFFYLPWEILDLHSCVFFCAKIDDCNNFGAKVQIRQSIGRPEGIVPLCTSSPHPIWFIWPFGQFSVLTRFEHWPHVYQDMADQGGFIFKKKLGHTCWTFNDFEEKWLTSDHPIMNLPFAIASSKNDCYFRHMCVCLSVAMKRWQQRFAKNERCAIKMIVEKLMFFFVLFVFGVFTVLRTTNKHR